MKFCPLCNGNLRVMAKRWPGYVEGSEFEILNCEYCNTSIADPLKTDVTVYGLIYNQPERVPGYARYANYAKEILKQRAPWRYLAGREECYWGIRTALDKFFPDKNIAILEAGSGLGYLTYALTKEGYHRVLGVDLEEQAVNVSKNYFKCDYRVADISTFSDESDERFDVILMSEVIEHIEAPLLFIASAKKLLKPGGRLICTTPSRDFGGSSQQVWATDLPPVHLWWFSERGLMALAKQVDLSIEFLDFTDWNKSHYRRFAKSLARTYRAGRPSSRLNIHGEPCLAVRKVHYVKPFWAEKLTLMVENLVYQLKNKAARRAPLHRSAFTCAIFKND